MSTYYIGSSSVEHRSMKTQRNARSAMAASAQTNTRMNGDNSDTCVYEITVCMKTKHAMVMFSRQKFPTGNQF